MSRLVPVFLWAALGAGCVASGSVAGGDAPGSPRGRWTVVYGAPGARAVSTPGSGGAPAGPGGDATPPGRRRAPSPRARGVPLPADPFRGLATWYGRPFHGRRNASGEIYDMHGLTAAHRTLPFGTVVRVKNLKNQREVEVRITDRGPFGPGRIIDLSLGAAKRLGMVRAGVVPVELRVVRWGKNCRTFHGRTSCFPSKHFPQSVPAPR